MDDDLRKKYAPQRNKRYAHLRDFTDEAKLANGFDWKNNQYDFYRLSRSIMDRLDSEFREKVGVRVDQLASAEEIGKVFRSCCNLYQEDAVLQKRGIYLFLYITMRLWLVGKTSAVLESRRQTAERIAA